MMCKTREYGTAKGLEYFGDFGDVTYGGVFIKIDGDTAYGVSIQELHDHRSEAAVTIEPILILGLDGNPRPTPEDAYEAFIEHGGEMLQPSFYFTVEPCGIIALDTGEDWYDFADGGEIYGRQHGPIEDAYWADSYGISRYWTVPADVDDEDQILALAKPLIDYIAAI